MDIDSPASSSVSSSPDSAASLAEAVSLTSQARQLDAKGSHHEAERLFRSALELIDQSEPSAHSALANLCNGLGESYLHMGLFDSAEEWFSKSLEVSLAIRDLNEMSSSRENLARVQRAKGELMKAKALQMMGAPDDMRCSNYLCTRGLIRTPDLRICGGCKGAFYCSHDCQQQDWERHKRHCARGMP